MFSNKKRIIDFAYSEKKLIDKALKNNEIRESYYINYLIKEEDLSNSAFILTDIMLKKGKFCDKYLRDKNGNLLGMIFL